MHELLIDLSLVKQVWQNIEQIEDAGLKEARNQIRTSCAGLLQKALSESDGLSPAALAEISALPPQQLAEHSLKVVVDVLAFVKSACHFYELVRSYQPLTEEEKHVGEAL